MTKQIRISSGLSFPTISEHARSVSVYLLSNALEYDGKLRKIIENASEMPTQDILTAVEYAYDRNQLALFDYDSICQMAKIEPNDYYASKIISNGLEYANVHHWFKRAVIQCAYQPLAYIELRFTES